MKKVVFVVLMAIVFSANCQTSNDSHITVNIGGVSINIPTPSKEFIVIPIKQYDSIMNNESTNKSMLCVVIDTINYKNICNNKNKSLLLNKYIYFGFIKELESHDITDNEFSGSMEWNIRNLKSDSVSIIENAISELNNKNDNGQNSNPENKTPIGCIYNEQDACGILESFIDLDKNRNGKILRSINMLKINKRTFNYYYCIYFNDINDVKQIIDFSKNYTKAILDANK